MSLEDRIKSFAEESRAILLEQLAQENEVDTAKVKWQGFNEDGKAIVKKGDKTEVVDGQGHVSNKKNTSMISDDAGSVEYFKKKKIGLSRYQKDSAVVPPPAAAKKKTADLVPSDLGNYALAIVGKRGFVSSLVIKYAWSDGRDLDTTTKVTSPVSDGPVGWAHGSTSTYLRWDGDDTSTNGVETVTVDVQALYEAVGTVEIDLELRGNWYSSAGTSASMSVDVIDHAGAERERLIWVAPLTLFEQGGEGSLLGTVKLKTNGTVTKTS